MNTLPRRQDVEWGVEVFDDDPPALPRSGLDTFIRQSTTVTAKAPVQVRSPAKGPVRAPPLKAAG